MSALRTLLSHIPPACFCTIMVCWFLAGCSTAVQNPLALSAPQPLTTITEGVQPSLNPTASATALPTNTPTPTTTATPTKRPSSLPSATITITTAPTEPVLPIKEKVALPTAVLIHQDEGKRLLLLDLHGDQIRVMENPGTEAFNQPEYIHTIGGLSPEDQTVPLALRSFTFEGGREVLIMEHMQSAGAIPAPDLTYLESAAGQPVIAYSAVEWPPSNTMLSHIYLHAIDDPSPPTEPLISEALPESRALFPIAVYAIDGEPQGVWITRQINGIGGVLFPPQRSLFYVDYATRLPLQALPMELAPRGLSPDYAYVAYTAGRQLIFLYLSSQKTVSIPISGDSTFGAGLVSFSPGNQNVAWTEGSGDLYSMPPNLKTWLRIATIAGEAKYRVDGNAIADVTGFQPNWVAAVAWLDEETVLIQAHDFVNGEAALVCFHLPNEQITYFAEGQFIDLIY